MSSSFIPWGDTSDYRRFILAVLVVLIVYVVVLVPLGGYGLLEVVASISVITGAATTVAGRRPVQNPLPHQV
jgi:hypothetical protein